MHRFERMYIPYKFWSTPHDGGYLYKCYGFTSMRSEPWREMIQSLFSPRFGVIMTLSAWLILIGTLQFLYKRAICYLWLDIVTAVIKFVSRIILGFMAYEFIVIKFPLYVRDMVTSELCYLFPYTSNEVSTNMLLVLTSPYSFQHTQSGRMTHSCTKKI